MHEINLRGKTALVTGAKQGIGKAIAETLAGLGVSLAALDLSLSSEDDICKNIRSKGVTCLPLSCDVADEESVIEAFMKIREKFGRLDILINNAGITMDAVSWKMTTEQFKKVLEVNLVGTFLCAKQGAILMKEVGNGGTIINISSMSAFTGNIGQSNYSASKAGVVGLTRTMALEYARYGIRVNSIVPGLIETAMSDLMPENIRAAAIERIPLKRIGMPSDVAGAVIYLASDLSSFVTGQCLHVNGGRYI